MAQQRLTAPAVDWLDSSMSSRWVTISSLSPICGPNFSFMGGVGKKCKQIKTWRRKIFLQAHIVSTIAGYALIRKLQRLLHFCMLPVLLTFPPFLTLSLSLSHSMYLMREEYLQKGKQQTLL
jgi:hypothetical protein